MAVSYLILATHIHLHLPTVTTVEELVNMASGKPVQLVYFDENNRLVFDHDGMFSNTLRP